MKLFTFRKKVCEALNAQADGLSVKYSREENGDFRADCSNGTVIIGGFRDSRFLILPKSQ